MRRDFKGRSSSLFFSSTRRIRRKGERARFLFLYDLTRRDANNAATPAHSRSPFPLFFHEHIHHVSTPASPLFFSSPPFPPSMKTAQARRSSPPAFPPFFFLDSPRTRRIRAIPFPFLSFFLGAATAGDNGHPSFLPFFPPPPLLPLFFFASRTPDSRRQTSSSPPLSFPPFSFFPPLECVWSHFGARYRSTGCASPFSFSFPLFSFPPEEILEAPGVRTIAGSWPSLFSPSPLSFSFLGREEKIEKRGNCSLRSSSRFSLFSPPFFFFSARTGPAAPTPGLSSSALPLSPSAFFSPSLTPSYTPLLHVFFPFSMSSLPPTLFFLLSPQASSIAVIPGSPFPPPSFFFS